jgi:hypothetical protein
MTRTGVDVAYALGMVFCWVVALVVLLVWLERRPRERQQIVRRSGSMWDSPLDRIGAFFSPEVAPMVGHWLRFYIRNSRFRMLTLFSLPLAAFLTYNFGQARKGFTLGLFTAVLGTMPIVTFMGTSRIAVNQFGYVGGAFRRFFLFPTDPAASMRAGSYTALILGAAWIPPAAILWAIFSPRPFDARMILMPVMNSVTALFAFHAIGLWTTIYGPRRGNYDKSLGNDMSLLGNITVIGSMLVCMFLPMTLRFTVRWAISPDAWWLTLIPAVLAIGFYSFSLRATTAIFPSRREKMLAIVEGRD